MVAFRSTLLERPQKTKYPTKHDGSVGQFALDFDIDPGSYNSSQGLGSLGFSGGLTVTRSRSTGVRPSLLRV